MSPFGSQNDVAGTTQRRSSNDDFQNLLGIERYEASGVALVLAEESRGRSSRFLASGASTVGAAKDIAEQRKAKLTLQVRDTRRNKLSRHGNRISAQRVCAPGQGARRPRVTAGKQPQILEKCRKHQQLGRACTRRCHLAPCRRNGVPIDVTAGLVACAFGGATHAARRTPEPGATHNGHSWFHRQRSPVGLSTTRGAWSFGCHPQHGEGADLDQILQMRTRVVVCRSQP